MVEIIKLDNVTFKYRDVDENGNEKSDVRGVFNIDLSIYQGEFIALVGHNGSGKSTLAKLLNGLLIPEEGQVIVDEMATSDKKKLFDIRKTVGMVFQNPDNQMIASIVEDDIAFGPENIGVPQAEIVKRVAEALECVNMSEYRTRTPYKLSGGQKQRIAIAGVLALRPRVIVFDESTAMLDPIGRREVMDTILKLNKQENMTVVLITHFMEEALNADRVVVLSEGRTLISGTPSRVFAQYEKLSSVGLDVPLACQLSNKLNDAGINVGENLTIEQLGDKLCQLL